MRRDGGWLERLPVKKRLIVMTFLVVLVTVALVSGCIGAFSYRTISTQAMDARAQLAHFTAASIAKRMQECLRLTELILSQDLVKDAISRTASGEAYPLAEQIQDAKDISAFTQTLESTSSVVRVRILLCGQALYSNELVTFFPMDGELRAHLAQLRAQGQYYTISEGEFPYIFQKTQRVVSFTRPSVSTEDFQTIEGGVAIDIATEEILSYMRNMLVSPEDAVTLYDAAGTPILRVGNEKLAQLASPGGALDAWHGAAEEVFFYETRLPAEQWLLSYRVQAAALYSPATELLRTIVLVLAAALLVALLMTITTSTAQSRRLLALAHAMDRVRNGDMDVRVEEGGKNEMGIMEHSFNYLADSLQRTLDARVEAGKQMVQLEMRLLQSQIKPHFLYNTLGLICWRLTKNGDLEGARYVQALAQFYRIGLNQGNALIALEQELRHVQLYVEIQNFRLDGAIALQITLPQELKDIRVPGNMLQPLVENSIVAGILEKPGGRGSVQISCAQDGKDLTILISDDGVGVDIAMVESVLNQRSDSHYGIWNVNRRLRLIYGERAGLAYSINAAGGVDVLVRIPQG